MTEVTLRALITLILASITLYGCSAANYRPNFKSLSPSPESFTITAVSPAGYDLEANALYLPRDGACPAFLGDMDLLVGLQPKSVTSAADSATVSYSFELPLRVVNNGCPLFPFRPSLTLTGPAGKVHEAKEEMFILLPDEMYGTGVNHDAFLSLKQFRRCLYIFENHPRRGDVSKTFSCNTYDEHRTRIVREYPQFGWHELQDKNIHFTFELEPEDNPKDSRQWVKTPEGYRACAKQESSFFCTEPPQFRQFKMDGQLCDVYPACKLQN